MKDSDQTGRHWGCGCWHQDQKACALGSQPDGLAEDLGCDNNRMAARLHHPLHAIPPPVISVGKI